MYDDQNQTDEMTNANLVLIFVNLLWILGVIWAKLGFAALLIVALVLHHAINRLAPYGGRLARGIARFGRQ
ncbi:hypothetical protein VK792_07730 [Mesobacterium sp. TK19101]|uniref:PRA1 family protein n=1 Tax=Mesobacterium hydrothermale TaxID=3111907 RepID=A0ABU6HJ55_9RHOB|nr:hypothetical protein [Mesobacterium sp. TK19101]MEC3861170.1 hypothetical protein [Mesobacterium sp. TK19101]